MKVSNWQGNLSRIPGFSILDRYIFVELLLPFLFGMGLFTSLGVAIAVSEIQAMIAGLRERQMGILITDHNVRETLAITNRAYIMREGQILAAGSGEELYNNPLVRQYYLGDNFFR